jgi:pyridoxine 5-phosphate synthase
MKKVRLGVNIDHVATLRQARGEGIPDLMAAAAEVMAGGADGLVCHLREDRRHIQDRDVVLLSKLPAEAGRPTNLDLECAATDEMVKIALKVKPKLVTFVPEKRQELTTEGGLNVAAKYDELKLRVTKLEKAGIRVSLFIEPDEKAIKKARETGASFIEIHTGCYANALRPEVEIKKIIEACALAEDLGLRVNAGHGLNYENVGPIAQIAQVEELNIGFSIIVRSVFVGLKQAVRDMVARLSF